MVYARFNMAEPEPETSVENPVPVEPSIGPPPDDVVVPDHKSDDGGYINDPCVVPRQCLLVLRCSDLACCWIPCSAILPPHCACPES